MVSNYDTGVATQAPAPEIDFTQPLVPWVVPACFKPSRAQLLHRVLLEVDRIGCMCLTARGLGSIELRRQLYGKALHALAELQPQVRELMDERQQEQEPEVADVA